jgi:hypothetical protein
MTSTSGRTYVDYLQDILEAAQSGRWAKGRGCRGPSCLLHPQVLPPAGGESEGGVDRYGPEPVLLTAQALSG